MHRFLLTEKDSINGGLIVIRSEELLHQWIKVLRFEVGEKVIVFDGLGKELETEIKQMEKKRVVAEIKREFFPNSELPCQLVLAQSLLKNSEKFEWILQKGTELGVNKFVPLITERTEQKCLYKKDRLKRILKEATEQSGRAKLPLLGEIEEFPNFMKDQVIFVPHPDAELKFSDVKRKFGQFPMEIVVCIGPEGGFTENEIRMAKDNRAFVFNIGKRILRAETAAVAMVVLINQWIGEM